MKHSMENSEKYPGLDQFSTERLNELLHQEFISSGETDPDVAFIQAIMAVIEQRNALEATNEEAEASLRQFHAQYMAQENASAEPAAPVPTPRTSPVTSFPPFSKTAKRPRRWIAMAATICVLVCLLAVPAQAGFWETFVRWTSEEFSFLSDSQQEEDDKIFSDAMYSQLSETVAGLTDQPVLPTWYPQGSSIIRAEENSSDTLRNVTVTFLLNGKEFLLFITTYNTEEDLSIGNYEKNKGAPEEYLVHGIPHYIMGNMERNVAVWRNGTTECCISGFLSVEELKQMIDSIYV